MKKGAFLFILAILLFTFAISSQIAVTANIEDINYRGTIMISLRYIDFLHGIRRNNIRFALWNGNNWIDLPFWVIRPSEHKYHMNLNYTARDNPGKIVDSSEISFGDYYILIIIPNEKGIRASSNNWWPIAKKAKANARSEIIIKPNNIESGSYVLYIYAYFGTNTNFPPKQFINLRQVYYNFDIKHDKISNSTRNKLSEKEITLSNIMKRFKKIYTLESIRRPICLKKEIMFNANDATITVRKNQILMKYREFKNTGYNEIYGESFSLPREQDTNTVYLVVRGRAPEGSYPRYLWIYLTCTYLDDNDVFQTIKYTLINKHIVSGSFSYVLDISSKVGYFDLGKDGSALNKISIKLTTWTGGYSHPNEYWVVNATVQYTYASTRDKLKTAIVDLARPRYDFKRTGWHMIIFPLPIPDNLIYDNSQSSITFDFHFQPAGDTCPRVLKIYLITDDTYQIYYDDFLPAAPAHIVISLTTSQIQTYFASATEAKIGIILTTYVGHWNFIGHANIKFRPAIIPDDSDLWSNQYIVYGIHSGNIYAVESYGSNVHNVLLGEFVYTVTYYQEERLFDSELSLFVSSSRVANQIISRTADFNITIKNSHGAASGTFKSIASAGYYEGSSVNSKHEDLVQGAAIILTLVSLFIPQPYITLLNLGKMVFSEIVGTDNPTYEQTVQSSNLYHSFTPGVTTTYDESISSYVARDNYFINFEDVHSASDEALTMFYNYKLTIQISEPLANYDSIVTTISLNGEFTYHYSA